MSAAAWALVLLALYLAVALGVRSLIQLRRTGSTGFRGLGGRPGSVEWVAGALVALATMAGALGPILGLVGISEPVSLLDHGWLRAAGFVIFACGLLATFAAQLVMGASWRIGVDATEQTALVTHGPFAMVRNPIFAAMIPASLGLVLLVPNLVAIGAWIALVIGLELQVRYAEEPYLLGTHGARYAEYAARVGRFLPFVGRLRPKKMPR